MPDAQGGRLAHARRRRDLGRPARRACRRRTPSSACCARPWPPTALDPAGVYFGTSSGELYASADEGETWSCIAAASAGDPLRRNARRGSLSGGRGRRNMSGETAAPRNRGRCMSGSRRCCSSPFPRRSGVSTSPSPACARWSTRSTSAGRVCATASAIRRRRIRRHMNVFVDGKRATARRTARPRYGCVHPDCTQWRIVARNPHADIAGGPRSARLAPATENVYARRMFKAWAGSFLAGFVMSGPGPGPSRLLRCWRSDVARPRLHRRNPSCATISPAMAYVSKSNCARKARPERSTSRPPSFAGMPRQRSPAIRSGARLRS